MAATVHNDPSRTSVIVSEFSIRVLPPLVLEDDAVILMKFSRAAASIGIIGGRRFSARK